MRIFITFTLICHLSKTVPWIVGGAKRIFIHVHAPYPHDSSNLLIFNSLTVFFSVFLLLALPVPSRGPLPQSRPRIEAEDARMLKLLLRAYDPRVQLQLQLAL